MLVASDAARVADSVDGNNDVGSNTPVHHSRAGRSGVEVPSARQRIDCRALVDWLVAVTGFPLCFGNLVRLDMASIVAEVSRRDVRGWEGRDDVRDDGTCDTSNHFIYLIAAITLCSTAATAAVWRVPRPDENNQNVMHVENTTHGKGPTTAALSADGCYQLTPSTVFALATFVQGSAFVPASTSPLMLSYAASQHLSGSVLLLEKGWSKQGSPPVEPCLTPCCVGRTPLPCPSWAAERDAWELCGSASDVPAVTRRRSSQPVVL